MKNLDFRAAWIAPKVATVFNRLEYGFLSLVSTYSANKVRWLSVFGSYLNNKGKASRNELVKLVAFHLTLPVLKLSNLFFKIAYFGRLRLLFLQTSDPDYLRLHKLGVYLGDCGNNLVVIGQFFCGPKQFAKGLYALCRAKKFGKHVVTSNVEVRGSRSPKGGGNQKRSFWLSPRLPC